jgi:hypothetical protein
MDSTLKEIKFVTPKNKYTIFYYKFPVSFGYPTYIENMVLELYTETFSAQLFDDLRAETVNCCGVLSLNTRVLLSVWQKWNRKYGTVIVHRNIFWTVIWWFTCWDWTAAGFEAKYKVLLSVFDRNETDSVIYRTAWAVTGQPSWWMTNECKHTDECAFSTRIVGFVYWETKISETGLTVRLKYILGKWTNLAPDIRSGIHQFCVLNIAFGKGLRWFND